MKVNVDNAPLISQRFQARSIPMLVLLRHGNGVAQQVGTVPPDHLMAFLEQSLGTTALLPEPQTFRTRPGA